MHPLFLDYKRSLAPPRRAGYIFLALGCALVLQLFVYHRGQERNIEQYQENLGSHATAPSTPARLAPINGDIQQLGPEIRQANIVLRQLITPWEPLFKAVESSSQQHGKNIALLTIKPDAEKRQIKISGEAKNLDVLLDYLRLLAKQESLLNVYLLSHQVQQQDRDKPVVFSLIAEWRTRS